MEYTEAELAEFRRERMRKAAEALKERLRERGGRVDIGDRTTVFLDNFCETINLGEGLLLVKVKDWASD